MALAERLAPEPQLLPNAAETRIRVRGLCHELMTEGGLVWNARLLAIDAGLTTDGREGFPLRAAQYLAPRAPLPDADCPLAPPIRAAFTWLRQTLADAITPALLEHRQLVVSRYFALPLAT